MGGFWVFTRLLGVGFLNKAGGGGGGGGGDSPILKLFGFAAPTTLAIHQMASDICYAVHIVALRSVCLSLSAGFGGSVCSCTSITSGHFNSADSALATSL